MRFYILCLMVLTGCSSQGKLEVPKDTKAAPTEMPKVRNAADGFKPSK